MKLESHKKLVRLTIYRIVKNALKSVMLAFFTFNIVCINHSFAINFNTTNLFVEIDLLLDLPPAAGCSFSM